VADRGGIGDDRSGPVAERNARAVHRSLSWFKSRPGLQPSLRGSFGSASQLQPSLLRSFGSASQLQPSLLRSFGSASQPDQAS